MNLGIIKRHCVARKTAVILEAECAAGEYEAWREKEE